MSIEAPDMQGIKEPQLLELQLGQRVMVLQSMHEQPEEGSFEEVGAVIIPQISRFEGTVVSLPEDSDTVHIGERRDANGNPLPTYVVPLSPVTTLRHNKEIKLLKYSIS